MFDTMLNGHRSAEQSPGQEQGIIKVSKSTQ